MGVDTGAIFAQHWAFCSWFKIPPVAISYSRNCLQLNTHTEIKHSQIYQDFLQKYLFFSFSECLSY